MRQKRRARRRNVFLASLSGLSWRAAGVEGMVKISSGEDMLWLLAGGVQTNYFGLATAYDLSRRHAL